MVLTKFNWQERAAYGIAALAASLGTIAGFSNDPDWLGRAGSVVIVAGVLLAASRKMDLLHEAILDFIKENTPIAYASARQGLTRKNGREPTESEILELASNVLASMTEDITDEIDRLRRVFKLHEITLVVAGTFLNGFGPWVIKSAQSAA